MQDVSDKLLGQFVETVSERRAVPDQDAIDLGATVVPVLLRTYWKPVAGAVLVLLALRWWRRR